MDSRSQSEESREHLVLPLHGGRAVGAMSLVLQLAGLVVMEALFVAEPASLR